MTGLALARAAEDFVGTRFRLGGRDPAHGLDCIGLLHVALERSGRPAALPEGYTLRINALADWLPRPEACGFVPALPPFAPGDLVLIEPGPAQVHLAIRAPLSGWVHAHAGLRRVVHQIQLPAGPVLYHWRLAPSP